MYQLACMPTREREQQSSALKHERYALRASIRGSKSPCTEYTLSQFTVVGIVLRYHLMQPTKTRVSLPQNKRNIIEAHVILTLGTRGLSKCTEWSDAIDFHVLDSESWLDS